jgi:hypothetical protein
MMRRQSSYPMDATRENDLAQAQIHHSMRYHRSESKREEAVCLAIEVNKTNKRRNGRRRRTKT